MNSVRANYTACCLYPAFVIPIDALIECIHKCLDEALQGHMSPCCVNTCCYVDKIGVFSVTEDENGNITNAEMHLDPLISSFLLSVGNDSAWIPVITNSVNRCYNDLWSTNEGYSCDFIPNSFYEIVGCAYLENYLKCPVWNPSNILECQYTHRHVEYCEN